MHISDISACNCTATLSGICASFEPVSVVLLLLLKTIKNQCFGMTLLNADKKEELLQTWCQLDGYAQQPCYGLKPTVSHISRFKVWSSAYIFITKRVHLMEVRG
jgi:hypothetical protein